MRWDRRVEGQDMDVPLDIPLNPADVADNLQSRIQDLQEMGSQNPEEEAHAEFGAMYAPRMKDFASFWQKVMSQKH